MIKVLEKSVSDKIAAGEVVERPLSIVKELFENSIDSGADNITVEIKNGGKSYIRVTDNGCGIQASEIETAFLRHATSKLSDIDDLDSLHTLGFRGEALASICAVSRMEVITKTPDEKYGTRLVMDGSEVIEKGNYGAPDGTTMIVRDLFFNTPAREKFLDSDRKEGSLIINFVSHMALAYPEVKIQLVNNNSILFTTPGRGSRVNTFATIGSNKIIENLIYFDEELENMRLQGYISNPGASKANRRGQVIFVNGRAVDSKVITKGLDLAYADRLFEGRFPSAYLFLEIAPDLIDVNIHPNKRSIKFYNANVVTDFVYQSIRQTLTSREAIPGFKTTQSHRDFSAGEQYESFKTDKKIKYVSGDDADKKAKLASKTSSDRVVKTDNKPQDEKPKKPSFTEALEKQKAEDRVSDKQDQLEFDYAREALADNPKVKISKLQIMGQVFNTYIVAKDDDAIYLIDQHAAQERIFFEDFKKLFFENKLGSQQLLLPFVVEIDIANMEEFSDKAKHLIAMGFEMEAFGPSSYRVTSVPHIFAGKQSEEFIEDFIAHMGEYGDFESKAVMDKIATRACKASVKANEKLSDSEMQQLIIDLEDCENPFSCPHGRPTFLKMTKSQIESRFLRK